MTVLFILMIASLVLTLLVSVVAIVMSTSNGTNWSLEIWNNLKKGRRQNRRPNISPKPTDED